MGPSRMNSQQLQQQPPLAFPGPLGAGSSAAAASCFRSLSPRHQCPHHLDLTCLPKARALSVVASLRTRAKAHATSPETPAFLACLCHLLALEWRSSADDDTVECRLAVPATVAAVHVTPYSARERCAFFFHRLPLTPRDCSVLLRRRFAGWLVPTCQDSPDELLPVRHTSEPRPMQNGCLIEFFHFS